MKKCCLAVLILLSFVALNATGVLVNKNNTNFQIARLSSCVYDASVTNQIAEVKVTETFINTTNALFAPRFYFPMPRGSNATQLRWFKNGEWNTASIIENVQSPPGGPQVFPDNFVVHIQLIPLIFDLTENLVAQETIKFELTYVQLLPYTFGSVTLNLRNAYTEMQTTSLQLQELNLTVESDKVIQSFDCLNLPANETHSAHTASAHYSLSNHQATSDYKCVMQLSTEELGSWGLSTFETTAPDSGVGGFFVFTVEEESLPAETVPPVRLNIVIDVSGSMTYENRLQNAKDAASYIVNHLNQGDYFNIILFDHVVRRLWTALRPNTYDNRTTALSYINNYDITSLNGTNLQGGLSAAIAQFSIPPQGVKNCVLLLSDGQPNVGITDTYQIVNSIDSQAAASECDPYIFCFGVGSDVNYQLLNMLAQHHNGISIFLESSEMVSTITQFYDIMRNPIMLNPALYTNLTITELYPQPFPSIYGGLQYRIVGRYSVPENIQIALSGEHEGSPQNYLYNYALASEDIASLSFVPKIWAAAKIDWLMLQYYSYPSGSAQALALKAQIVEISFDFGVVTAFTSFNEDPPIENIDDEENTPAREIVLYQNYPNPFNPETTLSFEVTTEIQDEAVIEIYNLKGQLVRILKVDVHGKGRYEIVWDGTDMDHRALGSGIYIYRLTLGKHRLTGKMMLQK